LSNFKYEIAISFLKEDEDLAVRLHDILSKRYSTFIYSKKQEELAGSDGEKKFNLVFGKESRIVIVLYRDKWGETSWTRIEENSIRNRAYNKGYDFVLFIALDDNANMPEWLPKTSIYFDYMRFGIDGLGSVIDRMVQRFGGSPTYESNLEKAQRYEKELNAERNLKSFLDSIKGLERSNEEFYSLESLLKKKTEEFKDKTDNWHFNIKDKRGNGIELTTYGHTLNVDWYTTYSNTLNDSVLIFSLYDGIFTGYHGYRGEPRELRTEKYDFTRDKFGSYGWKRRSDGKFFTNPDLLDYWLDFLIDIGFKRRKKDHT